MPRFLHLADLHLGSRFSMLDRRRAAAARETRFTALEDMIGKGLALGAKALLFAGDVFDGPAPAVADVQRFYGILENAGVPAVIAPGNHDPYITGGLWTMAKIPANVCLFTDPGLAYFDFPELDMTVYGFAFTGEKQTAPRLKCAALPGASRTPVLLAHGDTVSPLSVYAPISKGELAESGFVYAALGHIHNPPPMEKLGRTLTAYSGFVVGSGFDEIGKGSVLLVDAKEGRATAQRLTVEAPAFRILSVDCTGAGTSAEVALLCNRAIGAANFPADTRLRVRLVGEVSPECLLHPEGLSLRAEGLSLLETVDETLPVWGAAYLEKDPTLRGAFYRALLPKLQSADEAERRLAGDALRAGLAALAGREVAL